MNKIRINTLSAELKYKNTVILKYIIEYPEIIMSKYRLGKEAFNRFNKNKALELEKYSKEELYKEAKELYEYNVANGYPIMVYEVVLKYDITYNNKYLLSLYSDEYQYTGGAHGITIRKSQNWNLSTAKQIPLQYFFPNNEYYVLDILKEINKQIEEQIQNGENQYFDNYCQLVIQNLNLDNYYINPNSITIFFQEYDIAPYSSGIPTFNIAFKSDK